MWDIAFSVLHFMAGVHIQLGYTVASYFAEHRWLYILRVSIFITEVFSVHIFPITYKPLNFLTSVCIGFNYKLSMLSIHSPDCVFMVWIMYSWSW